MLKCLKFVVRCQKNFKFTLHVHISWNQHKITIESNSYNAMLLYLFFNSSLSTCPKKKYKLKNGPGLPTLPNKYYVNVFDLVYKTHQHTSSNQRRRYFRNVIASQTLWRPVSPHYITSRYTRTKFYLISLIIPSIPCHRSFSVI